MHESADAVIQRSQISWSTDQVITPEMSLCVSRVLFPLTIILSYNLQCPLLQVLETMHLSQRKNKDAAGYYYCCQALSLEVG